MLSDGFLSRVGTEEHVCGARVLRLCQCSSRRRGLRIPTRRRMINLVLDKGKVQFEIAHDAIERSNIHFSSKFLSLAKANHESYNQQADGPRQLRVKISPEYPTIARRMNLKGAVELEALVGRDGTVREVKVLGGHPLLADALARAVKQWKYEPAAKDSTEVVKYSFGPEY